MITEILYNGKEAAMLTGFPGGKNKFYEWLRKKGFLDRENTPYIEYRIKKWFTMKTKVLYDEGNFFRAYNVPLLTELGISEIRKLVTEHFKNAPGK